jgi:hypothetical protein
VRELGISIASAVELVAALKVDWETKKAAVSEA